MEVGGNKTRDTSADEVGIGESVLLFAGTAFFAVLAVAHLARIDSSIERSFSTKEKMRSIILKRWNSEVILATASKVSLRLDGSTDSRTAGPEISSLIQTSLLKFEILLTIDLAKSSALI